VAITDVEALKAFDDLCRYEGIIPALESAHAAAYAAKIAPDTAEGHGPAGQPFRRGDKDMHTVAERRGLQALMSRIAGALCRAESRGAQGADSLRHCGRPAAREHRAILHGLVEGRQRHPLEIGVPFSDPMADGPAIQRASERALKNGVGLADVLGLVADFRKKDS
jgi:hypothetical protein